MFETKHIQTLPLPSYFCFHFNLENKVKQPHGIMWLLFGIKMQESNLQTVDKVTVDSLFKI